LEENMKAAEIALSTKEMQEIEAAAGSEAA
jgi:aryl-alcohol dehydrogenase-like predicted oxidoreductase